MFSYIPLFTLLVQKGMTKTQLREAVGIGTGTLAKMSKGEYVAMFILSSLSILPYHLHISQYVLHTISTISIIIYSRVQR